MPRAVLEELLVVRILLLPTRNLLKHNDISRSTGVRVRPLLPPLVSKDFLKQQSAHHQLAAEVRSFLIGNPPMSRHSPIGLRIALHLILIPMAPNEVYT